tara:strand:- start:2468 stop:2686 length:219 start_codon:yes stop_codon:yes gene_type:complete
MLQDKKALTDLGERCVMTFAQSFLAIVTAGPMVGMDADIFKAGAAAGVAAVLSVLKSFVASKKGDGSGNILT